MNYSALFIAGRRKSFQNFCHTDLSRFASDRFRVVPQVVDLLLQSNVAACRFLYLARKYLVLCRFGAHFEKRTVINGHAKHRHKRKRDQRADPLRTRRGRTRRGLSSGRSFGGSFLSRLSGIPFIQVSSFGLAQGAPPDPLSFHFLRRS